MMNTKVFFTFSYCSSKIIFCFFIVLIGCQPKLINDSPDLTATEGYSAEQTNNLFVVDCLLPGQIRKLGNQMTYLTARRPIKTTAGECEIRGGEYVAYDRSNYASALKVWLPQAKQGNVDAQVMLGEIYEKGLGSLADPALAAQWYKKAAETGNSRAQINLGHLYEKGIGVEQNLTTALNWYRKASGLENTDLEFASVTKASVSASYEKKLDDLKKQSDFYQEQAADYQKKLLNTQNSLSVQQKKLNSIKYQLEQTQKRLNQAKSQKNIDQKLVQKLETELHNNKSSFKNQKAKLTEIQVSIGNENQGALSSYQSQLESLKQRLQLKEGLYHDAFVQIKTEMSLISEQSSVAKTTQEKLAVEQLRSKLKQEKSDLLVIGRQIKQLKSNVSDNEKIIASLKLKGDEKITLAHAGIEIIDPPMILTRGMPSYQLRSIRSSKKIIGKLGKRHGLQSLTVNGYAVEVDDMGVFQSLVDIQGELNPVKIIATYHKSSPTTLDFNLLTKSSTPLSIDLTPPKKVFTNTYPSINFGRFYALVIGNENYEKLPSLKTAVNDAKAVEEVLRVSYGYKTTLLINANRHQVMTAFNDLRKILTEKDNLLIYYAGHGEIDKSDQSAYWLPTDAELNNTANWLSSHSLTQFLNIISAKHIFVVADSCYSGAMTQSTVTRLPAQMSENKREKWLKFMVKRKGRTVLTSGGVKPVLDSGGGKHSIFAKAFLTVLKQNSGLMEDYELFGAVSGNVKKSASAIGFHQVPQYSAMLHAGHEGSPFFFIPNP